MGFTFNTRKRKDTHCKNCVPPKRHPGCHDTCELYQKDKAEWEEYKETVNNNAREYYQYERFHKERIIATKEQTKKARVKYH